MDLNEEIRTPLTIDDLEENMPVQSDDGNFIGTIVTVDKSARTYSVKWSIVYGKERPEEETAMYYDEGSVDTLRAA